MSSAADTVKQAILSIAPELDDSDLAGDARLREDLDLDSMDFLDVVTDLSERTGMEIPESDYPQLATISGCIGYLERHSAPA